MVLSLALINISVSMIKVN